MRFFSNDAREASDDDAQTDEPADTNPGDQPGHVKSEPVAVPVQRAQSTSPWAASPGTAPDRPGTPADRTDDAEADAELADRETLDGTTGSGASVDSDAGRQVRDPDHPGPDDRHVQDDGLPGLDTGEVDTPGSRTGERSPFHEPAPQDTAFGAATVGGAVAASARANPLDDRADAPTSSTVASPTDANTTAWDGPDTDTAADDHVQADRVRTGTGPADAVDTDRVEAVPADVDVNDKHRADRGADDVSDLALEDGGTFSDPVVVEKDGDARTFAGAASTSTSPDLNTDSADASTDTGPDTDADTVVAGAPKEQLPGSVTAPELGPLFADPDAHAFRDRWRDVQLRFVDDPKAAADDAANLVDEAVDALAASLRSQKEQLAGAATSDDTEQLRVRIRGYRDFLDRLLGL